jgi:soluble lytic murein transglycosylase-like protein
VEDVFDARQNLEGGARYLRELLDRYREDATLALAAYNAGPGRVDRAHAVPYIPETRDYVYRVIQEWRARAAKTERDAQKMAARPEKTGDAPGTPAER